MVNCARAGNIRPTHVSGRHIVFRPGSVHSRHPRSDYKLGPEEHRAKSGHQHISQDHIPRTVTERSAALRSAQPPAPATTALQALRPAVMPAVMT